MRGISRTSTGNHSGPKTVTCDSFPLRSKLLFFSFGENKCRENVIFQVENGRRFAGLVRREKETLVHSRFHIAEKYGDPPGHVSYLVRNKSWIISGNRTHPNFQVWQHARAVVRHNEAGSQDPCEHPGRK